MSKLTNFMVDSLSETGEIKAPLVVRREQKDGKVNYLGFIPGLTQVDIIEKSQKECEEKLKTLALNLIKEKAKNNEPFPFFPTKEEVMVDYDGVVSIKFITIKSNKRKGN